MAKYVAFLRGVNVGGKNKVGMKELRELAVEVGLLNPQTVLQSGNLVFEAEGGSESEWEAVLEKKHLGRFGFGADYHVRSAESLRQVVSANPFSAEAIEDPSHLLVALFKSPLGAESCENLRAAIRGRERFQAVGREAYLVYPDGIGDSKLTPSVLDSKLGQRGTARNWNTLLKLLALCA